MAEPLAHQPSPTKAIRSARGQAPLFEVDQRTGSVYTFTMATSTLSTAPPGRVYVNEPWLSIRWDSVKQHVLFVPAAKGLGKLTIEDVARLLDDDGLQSRTFDSIAAARNRVSEARASG